MENGVDWHEKKARELFDQAWEMTSKRWPASADTLRRRVVRHLLVSALELAIAEDCYTDPSEPSA